MPKYLPFHHDLPFALALGAHIVERSREVIRIGASQHQFSSWEVLWVSDAKADMLMIEKYDNVIG